MKKLITTILFLFILSISFAQSGNKDKYKDYSSCTESSSSLVGKSSTNIISKSTRSNNGGGGEEAKRIGKRFVSGVVALTLTIVGAVIYNKSMEAVNEIQ